MGSYIFQVDSIHVFIPLKEHSSLRFRAWDDKRQTTLTKQHTNINTLKRSKLKSNSVAQESNCAVLIVLLFFFQLL